MGALVLLLIAYAVGVRTGGRPAAGEVVVRCRAGHLFTTTWVPMASIKAIRLGVYRLQRCPIGHHWSLVRPVDPDTLPADELAEARRYHDVGLP